MDGVNERMGWWNNGTSDGEGWTFPRDCLGELMPGSEACPVRYSPQVGANVYERRVVGASEQGEDRLDVFMRCMGKECMEKEGGRERGDKWFSPPPRGPGAGGFVIPRPQPRG